MKKVGSQELLTQKELIREIADDIGYHYYEVDDVLKGLRSAITKALAEGKVIRLTNLFTLKTMKNEPRAYRNPRNGELIHSDGSIALRCKPTIHLNDVINGRKPAVFTEDSEDDYDSMVELGLDDLTED